MINNEEKAISIIKSELRGIGVLDGDENMIWKSPDNNYTFRMSRSELYNDNFYNNMPRYIINVEVLNEIGIKMFEMKFSELDAIRILDNIQEFAGGDMYYQTGDGFIIPINAKNTLLDSYEIQLEYIYEVEDKTMSAINYDPTEKYDPSMCDNSRFVYRDILMKIVQYNPIENRLITRVTIKLDCDEINDFAFKLFFASIMDIDFPEEYGDVLDKIDYYVSIGSHEREMLDLSLMPNINPPTEYFMNQPIYSNNNLMTLNLPKTNYKK